MKIKNCFLFLLFFSKSILAGQYSILLNPSGSAKSLGRNVFGDYERGITLKIACALQKALLEKGLFKVALSRRPGDEITDYSLVSLVNRFAPSFYLSIHVYAESSQPKIDFYYLVYNKLIDFHSRINEELDFISIYMAHFQGISTSSKIAKSLAEFFSSPPYNRYFECGGSYGIPFKPLRGVISPAVAIEIGLSQEGEWMHLIEPLAAAINDYFRNC